MAGMSTAEAERVLSGITGESRANVTDLQLEKINNHVSTIVEKMFALVEKQLLDRGYSL